MNEDALRVALRKIIDESPAFKKHFKRTETPLESTEAVSEGTDLTEGEEEPLDESWWEETDPESWKKPCPKGQERDDDGECKEKEEEEEKPLKEWYDNSLYKKLLKESIRRKK